MTLSSDTTADCVTQLEAGQGLLLVGHGSREAAGVEQFLAAAEHLAALAGPAPVEPCFLEFAEPTIETGFRRLAERGVREVVVVPALLFAAGHAKRDIPAAVANAARSFPHLSVRQSPHLGCQEQLLALSEQRFAESLAGDESRRALLVLVGRGSRDSEATAEMHAFASFRAQRAAQEMRVEVGFVAMAEPRLEDVLHAAARSSCETIVVQPHLLFGGVLVDRIRDLACEFAGRYPAKRWIAAGHLGPDPCVAQALLDRARESSSPIA